jgi:hypothetical protein
MADGRNMSYSSFAEPTLRALLVLLVLAEFSLALSLAAQQTSAQATYTLKPTPKTVAWGSYDAKAAPVLRVKSGDTVEIQTLITNSPKRQEEAGLPPEQVEQSLCVALRFS